MRTAYGLNAVYGAGLNGAGQTIVIVDAFGSSTIAVDAEKFSKVYGLPDVTPANFQIVKAPGISNNPKRAPGNTRLVPDISWLADPYTGVEFIMTDPTTGQFGIGTVGGKSLACPMFSALMAIASEKAGHGLGQAAQLLYSLPAGAVTDVTTPSSASNVIGLIDGSVPSRPTRLPRLWAARPLTSVPSTTVPSRRAGS